eukprot:3884666-Prymnesium_polylepis.1
MKRRHEARWRDIHKHLLHQRDDGLLCVLDEHHKVGRVRRQRLRWHLAQHPQRSRAHAPIRVLEPLHDRRH